MPPLQRTASNNGLTKPLNNGFLSLSHIHRLLRPLRNKVKSLAKTLEHASRKPSSSSNASTVGPLAVVPRPACLQSRKFLLAHGEWDPSRTIHNIPVPQFSAAVYGITDAFRNIVARAYGDELILRGDALPTLMEISTAIIGADIEASVMELLRSKERDEEEGSDEESEDESEQDDDDEDEADIIDGCYEQIPEHLRRWAIVPHALSIISIHLPFKVPSVLETCMDVALEFNAMSDAATILRRLLSFSMTRHDHEIPLRAPQHDDYLVHVLRKPYKTCWSDSSFVIELMECVSLLSKEDDFQDVWLSSAMQHLRDDIGINAQVHLTYGLASLQDLGRLGRRRLRLWEENLIVSSISMSAKGSQETCQELHIDLPVVLGELATVTARHAENAPPNSETDRLNDMAVCLAVHALYGSPHQSHFHLDPILAKPTSPASFLPLTSAIFDSFSHSTDIPATLAHAAPLRSLGHVKTESAFLSSSLNHLDLSRVLCSPELQTLRHKLEEAEALCVDGETWRWDEDHGWLSITPAKDAAVALGKRRRSRSRSGEPPSANLLKGVIGGLSSRGRGRKEITTSLKVPQGSDDWEPWDERRIRRDSVSPAPPMAEERQPHRAAKVARRNHTNSGSRDIDIVIIHPQSTAAEESSTTSWLQDTTNIHHRSRPEAIEETERTPTTVPAGRPMLPLLKLSPPRPKSSATDTLPPRLARAMRRISTTIGRPALDVSL